MFQRSVVPLSQYRSFWSTRLPKPYCLLRPYLVGCLMRSRDVTMHSSPHSYSLSYFKSLDIIFSTDRDVFMFLPPLSFSNMDKMSDTVSFFSLPACTTIQTSLSYRTRAWVISPSPFPNRETWPFINPPQSCHARQTRLLLLVRRCAVLALVLYSLHLSWFFVIRFALFNLPTEVQVVNF